MTHQGVHFLSCRRFSALTRGSLREWRRFRVVATSPKRLARHFRQVATSPRAPCKAPSEGHVSAEAPRRSFSEGLVSAEAPRRSFSRGLVSAETPRRSFLEGLVSAKTPAKAPSRRSGPPRTRHRSRCRPGHDPDRATRKAFFRAPTRVESDWQVVPSGSCPGEKRLGSRVCAGFSRRVPLILTNVLG